MTDPLPARLMHEVKVKLGSSRVSGILRGSTVSHHILGNVGNKFISTAEQSHFIASRCYIHL